MSQSRVALKRSPPALGAISFVQLCAFVSTRNQNFQARDSSSIYGNQSSVCNSIVVFTMLSMLELCLSSLPP